MTKAGEGLCRRHDTGQHTQQKRRECDHIEAPASPDKQNEQGAQDGENLDLRLEEWTHYKY